MNLDRMVGWIRVNIKCRQIRFSFSNAKRNDQWRPPFFLSFQVIDEE